MRVRPGPVMRTCGSYAPRGTVPCAAVIMTSPARARFIAGGRFAPDRWFGAAPVMLLPAARLR